MPLPRCCPDCGAPVERAGDDGGRCRACGREVWANPKPTAGVLLEREGKLLLVRRAGEPRRGAWDLPGGFLREGETPEAGARREVCEELGIELGPLRFLFCERNPLADGEVLDLLFECSELHGEPRPGSDVAALAWVDPDRPPAELAFAATARILARWRELRRGPAPALLDGTILSGAALHAVAGFDAPLAALPPLWRAECGDWGVHDGVLCGRIQGEAPAALWLDTPIEGDHALGFTAWSVPPAGNDINCYWEGAGRVLAGGDSACTIAGVGGWWRGLSGIERHPDGGARVTGKSIPILAGRSYRVLAGRRGPSDFLFIDGQLAVQIDQPDGPRRPRSRVALATWNGHVHFAAARAYRLVGPA